tara:strand:- start:2394 stop:3008 length:615 start_codon:yes stop_codon:yes gene_type:complete
VVSSEQIQPGGITGGIKLNLGCGKVIREGWVNHDIMPGPGVDLIYDLESCGIEPFPLPDDSVEEIHASHLIEHIDRVLPFMQEMWRIAKKDCRFELRLPFGATDMAWADPTHKRPFFIRSFDYFQQPFYNFADYGYRGDWGTDEVTFLIPKSVAGTNTAEELMHRINTERNLVAEMVVNLVAHKPLRANDRALITLPKVNLNLV